MCCFTVDYLSSALISGKRLALGYLVIVLSVDPLHVIVHIVPSVRLCAQDAGGLSDYDRYHCSSLITVSPPLFLVRQCVEVHVCVLVVSLRIATVTQIGIVCYLSFRGNLQEEKKNGRTSKGKCIS